MNYIDLVESIKELKRNGNYEQAKELLVRCVEETEKEDKLNGWGVAPWYYEQLAIIYRKEKDIEKEIQILKRYDRQNKAPGAVSEKRKKRLLQLLNG